jgi:hypothetical protein
MSSEVVPNSAIKPIAELFRPECVALWATTYNLDIALFNEYLLRRLGDPPLNAVVLADRERVDAALEHVPQERLDILSPVNRRWLLRGARIGMGRFHPKSYLAVTARTAKLLVGSGNLSSNGIDVGREVFTAFVAGTPNGDAAIRTWCSWMRRLIGTIDDTLLAERFADLEQRLPDPTGLTTVSDSPLWHNLERPLADQLLEVVRNKTGVIDELWATAPFYDETAEALGRLVDELRPARVRLFTTSSTSVDGHALAARLDAAAVAIETLAYLPDRFTHAKLIGVIAGTSGWMVSGSANLSRAALSLTAEAGNVELAVFAEVDANVVRGAFLPPDVTAEERPLTFLHELNYQSTPDATEPLPVRLVRASLLPDGRVHLISDPAPEPSWRLTDLGHSQPLVITDTTATTVGPLEGQLVHFIDHQGVTLSNRIVVDDPDALARVLERGERTESGRPSELTATDLDSPLGKALLWLHQNAVMDVTERAGTGGGSDATRDEAAGGTEDDSLWDRLEREKLARDPRASTYERLLGSHPETLGGIAEPLIELLDAMRDRAPSLTPGAVGSTSLLERLRVRQLGQTWSLTARIRVRARNVLRRWAAAQTDPRLMWVDPYAPIGNLTMVAAIFAATWCHNAEPGAIIELPDEDLEDLWERWFRPFVGTGQGDGWLDHVDITDERLRMRLTPDLTKSITVLCWLAIRPARDQRKRIVAWQPYLRAAFDKNLIDDGPDVAEYLSVATGRTVYSDNVMRDLLDARNFIDDDLWCERTAEDLGLTRLTLEATSSSQQTKVKVNVKGVEKPLYDSRLPALIVEVSKYRSTHAISIFGTDRDWRIVVAANEPVLYKASLDAPVRESPPLSADGIADLATHQGVLASVFPSDARVA